MNDETVDVVTQDSQGVGGDNIDHQEGSSAIEDLVEKGATHEFHEPQPHIWPKGAPSSERLLWRS